MQILCADNGYAKNIQYSKSNLQHIFQQEEKKTHKPEYHISLNDFSSLSEASSGSSRGNAAMCEVVIESDPQAQQRSELVIRGVLATGWEYAISSKVKSSMVGSKVSFYIFSCYSSQY